MSNFVNPKNVENNKNYESILRKLKKNKLKQMRNAKICVANKVKFNFEFKK